MNKLKEKSSFIKIEDLKTCAIMLITYLIATPLMLKGFFWFIGLWGYN